MTTTEHLWAIGFDDMTRADQVRDKITESSGIETSLFSRTWWWSCDTPTGR